MKKLSSIILKYLTAAFLFSIVAFSQTVNLKIIETSDVHGAIVPYDLIKDTSTSSSLAQVHTFANYLRRQ